MITLTGIIALYIQNNLNDFRLLNSFENEKKAKWIAFAGISKAMSVLNSDKKFTGILPKELLNNGECRIEIQRTEDSKIKIISTGIYKNSKIQSVEYVRPDSPQLGSRG